MARHSGRMSLRALFQRVNIEPVILIAGVSVGVYFTVLQVFVYRKECIHLYGDQFDPNDLYAFCRDLSAKAANDSFMRDKEDQVQQAVRFLNISLRKILTSLVIFSSIQ